jgi:hypothetical protein
VINDLSQRYLTIVLILSFGIFSIQQFFEIYRILVFDTTPHDSYHIILGYWTGTHTIDQMWSPTFYRFGYTLIAYLFYEIIPFTLPLSKANLNIDLHGMQSLAFASTLSLIGFLLITYLYLTKKLLIDKLNSIFLTFLFYLFAKQVCFFGVDSFTLAYTVLIIYFLDSRWYVLFLSFSFLMNEKIPLLFMSYFGLSIFLNNNKKDSYWPFVISCNSLIFYFIMKSLIGLPGFEFQTDLLQYPQRFKESLKYIITFKGLYMNNLSLLFLILIGLLIRDSKIKVIFITICISFFVLGLCLSAQYTIGRYAVHALPLFLLGLDKRSKILIN